MWCHILGNMAKDSLIDTIDLATRFDREMTALLVDHKWSSVLGCLLSVNEKIQKVRFDLIWMFTSLGDVRECRDNYGIEIDDIIPIPVHFTKDASLLYSLTKIRIFAKL